VLLAGAGRRGANSLCQSSGSRYISNAAWGVQVVPAHGHGRASLVAQFLDLAYEGSSIVVVLDAGSETTDTKAELEARFGERISVHLLPRTEIEGFFTATAVTAWLSMHGVELTETLDAEVTSALDGVRRKAGLRRLSSVFLKRDYSIVEDGATIARLMTEAQIAPEVRG
jgi:hypothetical protein